MNKEMPNKTAYLAGPMEYCTDGGIGWRLVYRDELAKLNIKCILPNEEEKEITDQLEMNILKKTDLDKYIDIMRIFIEQDLNFVETVDMVIINWNGERMSGTIGEAQHAYLVGTPCYLVTSIPKSEIPGWFLATCTEVFDSLGCFLLYLKDKMSQ